MMARDRRGAAGPLCGRTESGLRASRWGRGRKAEGGRQIGDGSASAVSTLGSQGGTGPASGRRVDGVRPGRLSGSSANSILQMCSRRQAPAKPSSACLPSRWEGRDPIVDICANAPGMSGGAAQAFDLSDGRSGLRFPHCPAPDGGSVSVPAPSAGFSIQTSPAFGGAPCDPDPKARAPPFPQCRRHFTGRDSSNFSLPIRHQQVFS